MANGMVMGMAAGKARKGGMAEQGEWLGKENGRARNMAGQDQKKVT